MLTWWEWLLWVLACIAGDPRAAEIERPKAAAAVSAARASMLSEAPTPTPPQPACDCGQTCVRGIWRPDGRIEQRCACQCQRCVAERAKAAQPVCTSGTCRLSSSAGR